MFATHYPALIGAYFVALAAWWIVRRFVPSWPASPAPAFAHPMRELLYALLGGVGVIAIGMLWSRGIRIPEQGSLRPLAAALNQLLIFAPILLVPILRRQGRDTAWLGGGRIGYRIAVGLVLGAVSVLVYSYLRIGAAPAWVILARMFQYDQLDKLVQVLLEDLTIAILFVRLAAKIGDGWAVCGVAALFAAGHIPALLASGASLGSLGSLLVDCALAVGVLYSLAKSRDILWFWPIHFMLDLTQFDPLVLAR
jgi:hypothetical protein